MATELNLDVLRGMGFDVPDGAGPNDLVVAVRADDADGAGRRLAAVATRSRRCGPATRAAGAATTRRATHRRLGRGARRTRPSRLVSVPGQHAFTEAMDALDAGSVRDALHRQRLRRAGGALKDAAADADCW